MHVILLSFVGLAALAACAGWRRRRFLARIGELRREIEAVSRPAEQRVDLPEAVAELARRLGASPAASATVRFTQAGEMSLAPGRPPTPFVAEQTVAVGVVGFVWQARFPKMATDVVDSLVGDAAGLEARVVGAVRVARAASSDAVWRGEAMRYLAELVWNPDAILFNRALDWRVLDRHRIVVETGAEERRCEVSFLLDEAGDIFRVEADDRPRLVGDKITPTPWFGRLGEWSVVEGRRVPLSAEVGWIVDASEFVYWRGKITNWSVLGGRATA